MTTELSRLLADLPRARVAVLGDFCLDVYWTMDCSAAETSIETGLATRPVRRRRCALGGAGNVTQEAKRMVLDRILRDIGAGNVRHMAAFGDEPVEIRETRKRGGLTVGIASDEVRRYGMNASKRSRLIRAGAHLIVPDFSQGNALAGVLGMTP